MEIPGYDKHHLEWKFQGGSGGMDIFWNYTLKKHNRGEQKLFSAVRYGTNVSISVHTTVIFFTLNPTKVPGYLQSTQFRDEHPENPGRKKTH